MCVGTDLKKMEEDSWSLKICEIEITYIDKENVSIFDTHLSHCYHIDGFCKPTVLELYTIVSFFDKICLIISSHNFIEESPKLLTVTG